MSDEAFEFLSAEEADKIASSYAKKINDKFVKSYLKVTVEYEIKESAKKGKKSVDIKIESSINDSTRDFIIDYLKSKGYEAKIITKTDCWRGECYDYKAFSVKWGKEN